MAYSLRCCLAVGSRASRSLPRRETADSSEAVRDGQPWIASGGCAFPLSAPALIAEELGVSVRATSASALQNGPLSSGNAIEEQKREQNASYLETWGLDGNLGQLGFSSPAAKCLLSWYASGSLHLGVCGGSERSVHAPVHR